MKYLIVLLAMTTTAWAQEENSSLQILSCQGEQTHELFLSWVDDEPLLTYYADDTAIATTKTADAYANDTTLYVPFLGTWYVFDENKGQVSADGNADKCQFLVAPSERIDPSALGFGVGMPSLGMY